MDALGEGVALREGHVLHPELAAEAVLDAAPVGLHHRPVGQRGVGEVAARRLAADLALPLPQVGVAREELRLDVPRVEGAELVPGEERVHDDVVDVGVVAVPRVY